MASQIEKLPAEVQLHILKYVNDWHSTSLITRKFHDLAHKCVCRFNCTSQPLNLHENISTYLPILQSLLKQHASCIRKLKVPIFDDEKYLAAFSGLSMLQNLHITTAHEPEMLAAIVINFKSLQSLNIKISGLKPWKPCLDAITELESIQTLGLTGHDVSDNVESEESGEVRCLRRRTVDGKRYYVLGHSLSHPRQRRLVQRMEFMEKEAMDEVRTLLQNSTLELSINGWVYATEGWVRRHRYIGLKEMI